MNVITDLWKIAPGARIPKRLKLLLETGEIIHGARQGEYGGPEDNFKRIAEYWSAFLNNRKCPGSNLLGWEVAIMMDLMKTARLQSTEGRHHDSWVDKAGYVANGFECSVAADEYAPPNLEKEKE